MKPEEAAELLYTMSNLAPINKQSHIKCERAKAVIDAALKMLAELAKKTKTKKTKGSK